MARVGEVSVAIRVKSHEHAESLRRAISRLEEMKASGRLSEELSQTLAELKHARSGLIVQSHVSSHN